MRRLLFVGLLLLSACNDREAAVVPPPLVVGTIAGKLTPFRGGAQSAEGGFSRATRLPFGRDLMAALRDESPHRTERRAQAQTFRGLPILDAPVEDFTRADVPAEDLVIPGDVIVRFEEAGLSPERALAAVALPGYRLVHKGYANEYVHLVGFVAEAGRAVTLEKTGELRAKVAALPGVRYTEQNLRLHNQALPNDRIYSFQWHYPFINLPAAWDVEKGVADVVVAVIDSGIVSHPELSSQVMPGYDMISDPANAGDGDGRDANPQDEGGDTPQGGSSWHGSHIAGTIGALTNNEVGGAGVVWNARILPVRVLGRSGATTFDIVAGITWATGGVVPGITQRPSTPAKVVNLSLGATAPPQALTQEAIDGAVGRGAIVVVAAGNSNEDASLSTPCNQENVICVGSTGLSGRRSSFSNYGARVDVMAPGGEMREDLNGDGYADGVLSTVLDDRRQPAFAFAQGTSMAAPHVAGVVALMSAAAARRSTPLTVAQAERVLRDTATAIPEERCPGGCGAGLIDAYAALRRIENANPDQEAPRLSVPVTQLYFRKSETQQLRFLNVGGRRGGDLVVTASVSGQHRGVVSFPGGNTRTVPAYGAATLEVAVETSSLAEGDYGVPLELVGSGGSGSVSMVLKIGVRTTRDRDAQVFFVWRDETTGEWATNQSVLAVARAGSGYAYSHALSPRTYFVLATIDDDGDGLLFEMGERTGYWRNVNQVEPIKLEGNGTVSNIDFDLLPLAPLPEEPGFEVGAPCASHADCPGGGFCDRSYPGGYCSIECNGRACPEGSKCFGDASQGPPVCMATCREQVGTGQGECREDYRCYGDGSPVGTCFPSCQAPQVSCPPSSTCQANGFCQ